MFYFFAEVCLLQIIQIKHQNQIRINLPIFFVTCVMCDDFVFPLANEELQMKNEELQMKNCK
jgi:hypothetical protein